VPVPEAPINKNGGMVPPQHYVRLTRHALHIQTVAVPRTPQPPPHLNLRLGVPATYA